MALFFYPGAMTSGCTKESCRFRDLGVEFAEVGAQRVGISADAVDKQHEFSEKHSFDFPLLSDPESRTIEDYNIRNPAAMTRMLAPGFERAM